MNHFIDVNGEPVAVSRAPITLGGVQYPRNIFTLWSRAEKLAIGIWEGEAEPIPEGHRATGWAYTFDGDHVNEVPTTEAVPPAPVTMSVEDLAAAIAPTADEGGGLVVGRWYPLGATVTVDSTVYDVIQPFLYANAAWQVEHLGAHLAAQAGPPGSPWAPSTPYGIGDLVTFEGSTYSCLQAHTSQAGWTPTVVPALWAPA